MTKISIAGFSAFLAYLLLAWQLTLRTDREVLLPAAVAATGLILTGALANRLVSGHRELPLSKILLLALATPLTGTVCILLIGLGRERELNTPEVQHALEPLGAALARGFAGIIGVTVGCLLAGALALLFSRRANRTRPEAPSGPLNHFGIAIGWTLTSAAGAYLFFAILGYEF